MFSHTFAYLSPRACKRKLLWCKLSRDAGPGRDLFYSPSGGAGILPEIPQSHQIGIPTKTVLFNGAFPSGKSTLLCVSSSFVSLIHEDVTARRCEWTDGMFTKLKIGGERSKPNRRSFPNADVEQVLFYDLLAKKKREIAFWLRKYQNLHVLKRRIAERAFYSDDSARTIKNLQKQKHFPVVKSGADNLFAAMWASIMS